MESPVLKKESSARGLPVRSRNHITYQLGTESCNRVQYVIDNANGDFLTWGNSSLKVMLLVLCEYSYVRGFEPLILRVTIKSEEI